MKPKMGKPIWAIKWPTQPKNPTEDTVEGHLVKRCKELHVPCEKLKGHNGWFDRVVFWEGGKPSLVELKRPKRWRYERLQQETHKKYADLGYDVWVLKSKAEVDKFIHCKTGK